MVNRDPIEENGDMNLYLFAGNDNLNLIDFLGLVSVGTKEMMTKLSNHYLAGSSYTLDLWICIIAREQWRKNSFHRTKNMKGSSAVGYSQIIKKSAEFIEKYIRKRIQWLKNSTSPDIVSWKREWAKKQLRKEKDKIPFGIESYRGEDIFLLSLLNEGESLYDGIKRSEAIDLMSGGWLLEYNFLKVNKNKTRAIKKYGDGTKNYVNAVLNCEKCLPAKPNDWDWYKKVFNAIHLPFFEKKRYTSCPSCKIDQDQDCDDKKTN